MNNTPANANRSSNWGTISGTVIVILLLVLAAFFLIREKDRTADAELSKELESLENEIGEIDLSEFETELGKLEAELAL